MKRLFILHLIFLLAYKASAQSEPTTVEERKVIKLIALLPEVIKSKRSITTETKGKGHLITYIDKRPTKGQDYYVVAVSQDFGDRLYTGTRFTVDVDTYRIRFWAVLEDKLIPLSRWRKHHYKDY